MEKRSCRRNCKRAASRLKTRYFYGNLLSSGTVIEASQTCMCIETAHHIPLNSRIELLIPVERDMLSVPVRIRGHLLTGYIHDIVSVEIVNPSREYLNFVKGCCFAS